jgi:hypothetical protein
VAKHKSEDPRGGHIRLYWDLVDSMAWRALSWVDQGVYIALRRKHKGTNNGNIEATLSTLRHAGITSPSTLAKSLRALQTVGLIAKTRQGGIAHGVKHCCLYRFTDSPTYDFPKLDIKACKVTNEWQTFKTLADARAAIKAAHAAAKRPIKPEVKIDE